MNLKLIIQYIKSHRRSGILLLVCAVTLAGVLLLFEVDVRVIRYAYLICFAAGLGISFWDFFKYQAKHEKLRILEKEAVDTLDNLPVPQDLIEQDYQNIIRELYRSKTDISYRTQNKYDDLVEYYTMWAHQIKTPISAMRLILQTELGQMTEAAEVNREMADELFKVEQYVDMVLGYLKLDEQGTDYVFQRCSLDDVIRQSLRKFAGQFIRSKNRLVFDETGKTVITDEKWLAFVMEQLLSNALKYTREGEIHIYMENPDTLVIRDTGIGIAADDVPRVFEKGFTGYNGRADKKSTGIGLYLCRRIVQNLGYAISCESEIGKGTAVKLDFKQKEIVHAD